MAKAEPVVDDDMWRTIIFRERERERERGLGSFSACPRFGVFLL